MDDKKVKCPACNTKFKLDDQDEEGDIIFCTNCEIELEITSLYPPQVAKVKKSDLIDEMDDAEDIYGYGDDGEYNDLGSGGDYYDDQEDDY
ncbi:MAG: hypothetical protein JXJ19_10080 [Elusimicrobia bacterium]|nr:hypothetical protein [Elusimicrobiota bacterium]